MVNHFTSNKNSCAYTKMYDTLYLNCHKKNNTFGDRPFLNVHKYFVYTAAACYVTYSHVVVSQIHGYQVVVEEVISW